MDSIFSISLVTLSDGYTAATTDAQRAAYVAAAAALQASRFSNLEELCFSVAPIIAGLVMLKGVFNKGVAYLGIAVGILGLVQIIPSLNFIIIVVVLLYAVWFLTVGSKLYKLGM